MRSAVFSKRNGATDVSSMKMHIVGQSPTAVRASWFHIVRAPLPSTAKRSTVYGNGRPKISWMA